MMAMTAASAAIGTASAVMQHDSQRRTSNQQADAMRENLAHQASATQAQQHQVNAQNAQQMSQRAREALVARGHLRAVTDAGNNAAARIAAEQDYLEATDMATLDLNRSNQIAQSQRELEGATRGVRQEMRALPYPTLLGTGLRIAGTLADAGANYAGAKQQDDAYKRNAPPNKG